MLPRINRLTEKTQFRNLKESGESYKSKLLVFVYKKTSNNFSRFGFVVSLKFSKKAVERNRTRRLLRESVRQLLPFMKPGFDILLIAKKELEEKPFVDVKKDVIEGLKKVGVFDGKEEKTPST